MHIFNTILCIILPLHQITINTNVRGFLMLGGMVNLTPFSLLTAVISLSQFISFFESHESTIVEFLFCYLSKWECKKYICGTLPFTALQVNPTMTTSAAEKPGNVKNVHKGKARQVYLYSTFHTQW